AFSTAMAKLVTMGAATPNPPRVYPLGTLSVNVKATNILACRHLPHKATVRVGALSSVALFTPHLNY
ncbi:MAG TPA: hypothetical protein VM577_04120, partial [Anaerovoracaceae bacterium]|nr:hypothetical protein [Anaerovoracaceae bacterium]